MGRSPEFPRPNDYYKLLYIVKLRWFLVNGAGAPSTLETVWQESSAYRHARAVCCGSWRPAGHGLRIRVVDQEIVSGGPARAQMATRVDDRGGRHGGTVAEG